VLIDVRIDETLWDAADEERRREWRLLIAELIDHQPRDESREVLLRIRPGGAEGTTLALEPTDGAPIIEVVLPAETLAPHFRAYLDVCRQMQMLDEGSHSARLEALDMGKRVMHDRAATSLLERCSSVIPDHATARRLFSLLTSLEFDLHPRHRSKTS
jgi:uncharacterized protein (UPF0262 family)